jgi:protein-tyrosine phosphatase
VLAAGKPLVRTTGNERSRYLAQTSPAADQDAENVAEMVSDEQVRQLITADGRRIAAPGVLNLRDLGGYPAAGGSRLRWRTLLRSD